MPHSGWRERTRPPPIPRKGSRGPLPVTAGGRVGLRRCEPLHGIICGVRLGRGVVRRRHIYTQIPIHPAEAADGNHLLPDRSMMRLNPPRPLVIPLSGFPGKSPVILVFQSLRSLVIE